MTWNRVTEVRRVLGSEKIQEEVTTGFAGVQRGSKERKQREKGLGEMGPCLQQMACCFLSYRRPRQGARLGDRLKDWS